MSGGSLMKFGTESKLSSGADVDCAKADGLISTKSPASNRFIFNLPGWRVRRCCGWTLERPRRGRQYTNGRHCNTIDTCWRATEDKMLKMALGLAALVLTAPVASADPVADFYRGRQISLIVGYGTGGGYDVYGRLMARHLGRHIPGHPNVVVQNMPGAGSLRAANHLYTTAPKDGSAIGTFGRDIPLIGIIGHNPNLRFEARKFTWLGSSSSYTNDAYMLLVRKDSAVASIADARRQGGAPLILGATGEGSTGNDIPILLRDALGLNIKLITGYPDGNA